MSNRLRTLVVSTAVLVLGIPVGLVAELVGDSWRRPALEDRRDPASSGTDAAGSAKVKHPAAEVARQARGSAERRRVVGRQGVRVREYVAPRAADPYRRLRPRRRRSCRRSRIQSVPGVGEICTCTRVMR